MIGAMRSVVQIHSPRLTEPEAPQRVRLRGLMLRESCCCLPMAVSGGLNSLSLQSRQRMREASEPPTNRTIAIDRT
jgi:hypothetical protein